MSTSRSSANLLAIVLTSFLVAVAHPVESIAGESAIVSITGTVTILTGDLTPGTGRTSAKVVPGSNLTVYAVKVDGERRDGESVRVFDAQTMATQSTAYAMTDENGSFTIHIAREFFQSGRSGSLLVVYGAFKSSRYYRIDLNNASEKKRIVVDLTTH